MTKPKCFSELTNYLHEKDKLPRWETYKNFFQVAVLRYLILWFSIVPVLAKPILDLPSPLPLEFAGKIYEINLSLPFNWQLLWVASLFYAIALAIYQIRCPQFIKKYNSFADYTNYSHHIRWLTWETYFFFKLASDKQKREFFRRMWEKNYIDKDSKITASKKVEKPTVMEEQTVFRFSFNNQSYKLGLPPKKGSQHTDCEKDIFYELFGRYSSSRPCSRLAIQILLIFTFVLFICVISQHIYTGAKYVFGWL